MQIFDAHLDMAWNALEWNRNLLLPVSEIRAGERPFMAAGNDAAAVRDLPFGTYVPGDCTVSWPELRDGQIGTCIATLLPRLHNRPDPFTFFQSPEAAYAASAGQLAYYQQLIRAGHLRQLSSGHELIRHMTEWEAPRPESPIGFILSMEGSWSILYPEQIHEWKEAGLSILGPAHYGPDNYGHGTGSTGGFNASGKELLRQMDQARVLLDVTHLSDDCFWEAMEIFQGPVLASHHNCRSLVPGDRQLTDEQIKTLIERGAVIGAVLDCWMLKPGWTKYKTPATDVSIETVVDHIDHICQLAGTSRHCGIGSDLDGGFGREQSPHDIDTIADLQKFVHALQSRGYSADDVEGIMWKNWQRFFVNAWSADGKRKES